MILVGVIDINELEYNLSLSALLPDSERKKLDETKSLKRKKEILYSRLLLSDIIKTFFENPMPRILYKREGKPIFENGNLVFSISHDKNLIAVAVSDESEAVGVDIQSFGYGEKTRERIEKRFLSEIDFYTAGENETKIKLLKFTLSEKDSSFKFHVEEIKSLCGNEENENCDFLRRWTRLESCLKLVGLGFKDLTNVNKYLQKIKFETCFLRPGCEVFCLSVADSKK